MHRAVADPVAERAGVDWLVKLGVQPLERRRRGCEPVGCGPLGMVNGLVPVQGGAHPVSMG